MNKGYSDNAVEEAAMIQFDIVWGDVDVVSEGQRTDQRI